MGPHVPNWCHFILVISILHCVVAFVRLDTPPPAPASGDEKIEFQNVTIPNLDEFYLKPLNADLTYLRVANSKIGKIDKHAFDQFKHLNLLEMSESEIKTGLDVDTFSRLPGLEILVLRKIGLREAALNLSHVQELILSQNKIEEFGGDSIVGKDVNYLDISNNKIKVLNETFKSLKKLAMIDVSHNQITDIGNDVFKDNTNLRRILAAENKISSTNGLRLSWLKTLNLFANNLSVLDSESFSKMTSLEELVLAFNKIKTIEDSFRDLLELKFLNLGWNRLEVLSPDLFRNNLYLSKLSLQGNRLKYLNRFVSVLNHLTHVDLSHNELDLIDDEFFTSMPNLVVLDLSFNKLKVLSDKLAPLPELKILNLAYNNIVLSGYEFSKNYQLSRVNLSSNDLERSGLSHFQNNPFLTSLDLSNNVIYNFCDVDVALTELTKVNLRGNQIRNLHCLKDKNFSSLCEVDLRNNPLTCGEELDDLIRALASRKGSPYSMKPEFHGDVMQNQCENLSLRRSFDMWNSVKRDLCPKGNNLEAREATESESTQETDESDAESFEELDESTPAPLTKKLHIVIPIGHIRTAVLDKDEMPQSERESWRQIDENAELINDLEEQEEMEVKKVQFSWYSIALILIGLSLTLTCFNLAVFMYIRLKVWKKKDSSSPQKYTFLHNEVYKNTTEPAKVDQGVDKEWLLENSMRNKIFTFGRINEFLLNFGINKKDKDTESTKDILINSGSNVQNV